MSIVERLVHTPIGKIYVMLLCYEILFFQRFNDFAGLSFLYLKNWLVQGYKP